MRMRRSDVMNVPMLAISHQHDRPRLSGRLRCSAQMRQTKPANDRPAEEQVDDVDRQRVLAPRAPCR